MNRRTESKSRAGWLVRFSPVGLVPWFRNHRKVASTSLMRLLYEPLQSLLTIGVIAIALALPTLLLQLASLGESALTKVNTTSDINVYFELDTSIQNLQTFQDKWQADGRVVETRLITPEQGLREFEEFSGLGTVLSYFDENPLPAVVQVIPEPRLSGSAAELSLLLQAIEAETFVDSVVFDFAWLDRLDAMVNFVDRLSIAVGILLALGIILILGNTIRLTIENRRDEIVVIKLVGGTDRFVQRPLLYTGFWYGILGAVGAIILVGIIGAMLSAPLQRIFLSYQTSLQALPGLSIDIFLKLLILGAVLGCLGAWISVKQHLRKIEPS